MSTGDAKTRNDKRRAAPAYEFRVLTIDRATSRSDLRALLAAEAEYHHWELARSRLYIGGTRRVWLRRRVQKVASTL